MIFHRLVFLLFIFNSLIQKRTNINFFNSKHNSKKFRNLVAKKPEAKEKKLIPEETVLTNHEFIPPYIDEMIKKYKSEDNSIYFFITPINKNVFHGDISDSQVNAMAGGKNNVSANSKNLTQIKTNQLGQEMKTLLEQIKIVKEQNKKILERRNRRNRRCGLFKRYKTIKLKK